MSLELHGLTCRPHGLLDSVVEYHCQTRALYFLRHEIESYQRGLVFKRSLHTTDPSY